MTDVTKNLNSVTKTQRDCGPVLTLYKNVENRTSHGFVWLNVIVLSFCKLFQRNYTSLSCKVWI